MLSNRTLITILIIAVLILVVLVGVWVMGKGGESGNVNNMATTTVRVPQQMTQEEKKDALQSLRFATPPKTTLPVADKRDKDVLGSLRISTSDKPAPLGIKETQDVLNSLRIK